MKFRQQHYVFGPVPSRRLGRSLGVDLVPFKTCTFDCIYCHLGRTTCHTIERKEWVPANAVLDELKRKLACRPDYITLSGSGEPTLHSGLDDIIEHIQAMTGVPVAVLTNGSLLWQPELRAELALADVVMPSLDAGGRRGSQRRRATVCSTRLGRITEAMEERLGGLHSVRRMRQPRRSQSQQSHKQSQCELDQACMIWIRYR